MYDSLLFYFQIGNNKINIDTNERSLRMDLPVQLTPLASNIKPELQPHTKDPGVLVQFCSQLSVPFVHSSMSAGGGEIPML